MNGVKCGCHCVGYQERVDQDPSHENPMQVLDVPIEVVNPTGKIGIVSGHMPQDPKGGDEQVKKDEFMIPLGKIFNKGLHIATGQCRVKRYNEYLRNLIIAGKAQPSQIVTERFPLTQASRGV
jgi:glutathione-independent formaldehyde dehydrogenase